MVIRGGASNRDMCVLCIAAAWRRRAPDNRVSGSSSGTIRGPNASRRPARPAATVKHSRISRWYRLAARRVGAQRGHSLQGAVCVHVDVHANVRVWIGDGQRWVVRYPACFVPPATVVVGSADTSDAPHPATVAKHINSSILRLFSSYVSPDGTAVDYPAMAASAEFRSYVCDSLALVVCLCMYALPLGCVLVRCRRAV